MATLATAQTELSWAGTGLRLTNIDHISFKTHPPSPKDDKND